jgi:serine/threonine-protein kinase
VLGTTDYVSPEQAMGQQVDARSDIYSLGVVLYEMLTGDVPFKADTVVGVAMKHVNEKMPDVQRRRRDVSSALAVVVERATEKKPDKRYRDMNEMLDDLERALEVEVARGGRSTGEVTTVLDSVSPRGRLITPRRVSIAGILLVLAATAAALIIVGISGNDKQHNNGGGGTPAPTGEEVQLVGANDFDPPPGDEDEHGEDVGNAIDGKPDTGWSTETYTAAASVQDAAGKPGVGLIVDAGDPVTGSSLSINSAKGGWSAQIYAAPSGPPTSLQGWGQPVGEISDASENQQVELNVPKPARYYLIWITDLAGAPGDYSVQLNEVALSAS